MENAMPHLDKTAKETGPVEVNRPAETNAPDANPDKLVLPEGVERAGDANDFRDLMSSFKTRISKELFGPTKELHLPRADRFVGEVGNSLAKPDTSTKQGLEAKQYLKKFDAEGVEYQNSRPDFSPYALASVTISHMTTERPLNYKQAYEGVAKQWNAEGREGRTDWKASDVKQWKKDNNLALHEKEDMKTCEFVPRVLHEHFPHEGGVSKCAEMSSHTISRLNMMQRMRDFYDQFDA